MIKWYTKRLITSFFFFNLRQQKVDKCYFRTLQIMSEFKGKHNFLYSFLLAQSTFLFFSLKYLHFLHRHSNWTILNDSQVICSFYIFCRWITTTTIDNKQKSFSICEFHRTHTMLIEKSGSILSYLHPTKWMCLIIVWYFHSFSWYLVHSFLRSQSLLLYFFFVF